MCEWVSLGVISAAMVWKWAVPSISYGAEVIAFSISWTSSEIGNATN